MANKEAENGKSSSQKECYNIISFDNSLKNGFKGNL